MTFSNLVQYRDDALTMPRCKPMRVFHVHIGNMPPYKATAYMDEIKDKILGHPNAEFYENIFVATQGDFKVEVIKAP